MKNPPIQCIFKQGAFHPYDARTMRDVGKRYAEMEVVILDDAKGRSKTSHDHFFATVVEAWHTLPEHLADRFPTSESLRHYALCKSGFCDVETFTASSRAEALRLCDFIRAGRRDGVQVVVNGASVTRLTPHSQSMRAMGGRVFQESKAAVLDVIAGLLETTADRLAVAA